MNRIELFVPGRLCLFGEHSDWAAKYRTQNKKIGKGYALTTCLKEGFRVIVNKSTDIIIRDFDKKFRCCLDDIDLIINSDNYYAYLCATIKLIVEKYKVEGIEIEFIENTLPSKKGLSSSAAICILVARAYSKIYNLNFSVEEEMNLAYEAEHLVGSSCGKLDQLLAYGYDVILAEFDSDMVKSNQIFVGKEIYLVFANLNGNRNTKKILNDLNKCYPFPKTQNEKNVEYYLSNINKKIVFDAIKLIEQGNIKELGKLMNFAQENFDKYMIPLCEDELRAKKLHKILNDDIVKSYVYGGKGVGAQGDGAVQFVAKDKKSQLALKKYLEKLSLDAYTLTIPQTNSIKKAIIPLAGYGSRMYPYTRSIPKAFIPLIHNNVLKPSILILLEELVDSGITEIKLIINRNDKILYERLFNNKLEYENDLTIIEERKLNKISRCISYIYQDEKLGLGHAISLCNDFSNSEPVLLLLGDQLCKSNEDDSCIRQLINQYNNVKRPIVSVCKVPITSVNKYGIIALDEKKYGRLYSIKKIKEKPSVVDAENNLFTLINDKKEYYAFFGHYILNKDIFDLLDNMIKTNNKKKIDYCFTTVLDLMVSKNNLFAFIPNGKMFDIGNVENYRKTLEQFNKEK